MQYRAKPMVVLAAALLLGVGGCTNEGSGGPDQTARATSAAAKSWDGDHRAQNNVYRTVKSGSGLRFFHRMEQPVRANSNHQVTISVGHDYPGQNLSLIANADDGLNLAVNRASLPMVSGRNADWTISFSAAADGVYYINVTGAVTRPDGRQDTAVFSVRVEVGEQKTKPKAAVDAVILSADEKIY